MIWLFFGSLFFFLLLGVPVAFSMLVTAVIMLLALDSFDAQIIAQKLISGANSFSLMAIPFFILTGEIMNAGGVSKRIIDFASSLVGHIRGGIGFVTILAGLIFSALSGSAVADTAALGAILIPMMVSKGYKVNQASGLVASAGMLGTVLPPSIPMILLGVTAGISVTELFMGGIIPGVIMALGLAITWFFLSRKNNEVLQEKASFKEIIQKFFSAIWALFLPFIIIIGLRGGVFTPTEAGVIAAVYALIISLFYREINIKGILETILNSAKTTSVVMFLAATAMVIGHVITLANVPKEIANSLGGFADNPTLLIIIIMIILLLVGAVMDLTPAVLIFTPVFMPIATAAGFDPIFFGVLMILNLSIGLITPPVGTALFVAAGIGKISIVEAAKGVYPFVLIYIGILIILTMFPQIILTPIDWIMAD